MMAGTASEWEEDKIGPALDTLQHPMTCLVCGPTMSGKTRFVGEIILRANALINPAIQHVLYCYTEPQPYFQELATSSPVPITFHQTLDELDWDTSKPSLLIIDDFMALDSKDGPQEKQIAEFFIKRCHHQNISVIYLVQNLFNKSPQHRVINLNAHYLVLFKNPRASSQIKTLAAQMYSGKARFMEEAYQDATSQPYGYLFIDLKQGTPDHVRIRTQILDGRPIVYVPK